MTKWICALLWMTGAVARADEACQNTPAYTPCEMVFELDAAAQAANPHPYVTADLKVEFRSPRHRTYMLPAYWDGGNRLVVRFTPTEAGQWDYRISGNVSSYSGKQGSFTAAASGSPGFIRPANRHHWAYAEPMRPHLWVGVSEPRFAFASEAAFRAVADARAAQKFTHFGGTILTAEARSFTDPDSPDVAYFQRLDQRIRYLNQKGFIVDLTLAGGNNELVRMFPNWEQRRRLVRFLIGRYSAMNITWQGVDDFESYTAGRELMKEVGTLLAQQDPYNHPRTSGAKMTSGPLLEDKWMNFITYSTGDDQLCSIEHQLFPVPFVSREFAREDSGAGRKRAQDVDSDTFRKRLWNATMDGLYPTYANTADMDPKYTESPGIKAMSVWFDLISDTRYWEIEPYFDVDGGRAVALPDSDYLVYIEKPSQPIELMVEKHGYDVSWINPASGEVVIRKKYKGEHFTGEAPDSSHDWLLRVAREGHIESMNRSYKFESRANLMQEIEVSEQKVPFEIVAPNADPSLGKDTPFEAKIKRETRATRQMMWLWTGESAADNQGYRVLATGQKGTMRPPVGIATRYPAVLHLRLLGLNANGKLYQTDRTYQLNP